MKGIISKDYNQGGILQLYLFSWYPELDDEIIDDTSNRVNLSNITATLYPYLVEDKASNINISRLSDGRLAYSISATLTLQKLEGIKFNELKSLLNERIVMLFEDRNSKWWIVGRENGLKIDSMQATTGSVGASNNYTLTISGQF